MPSSRAVLISAVTIAAAIVCHGYIVRPAQYSYVQVSGAWRLDNRSGELVPCFPSVPGDGTMALQCEKKLP